VHLSLDRFLSRATHLSLISGMALAASCSSAVAENHETWRCNVPNGHYDENALPISEKSTSISGRITFHKADFNPEWNSLARISIKQNSPEGGNCHCSGITAYAFPNPDVVEFHMKANGEDVAVAQSPFETPIAFKISINPQGVMTVAIGESDPEIKVATLLHPEHDTMVLACSGADVSFLNVEVR
jgi:hypothetical protein